MFRIGVVFALALSIFAARSVSAIEAGPELVIPGGTQSPAGPPEPYGHGTETARPAVSVCGPNYLVAWGASDGAVYAVRVSPGGSLLDDAPILVAAEGSNPAVASNGQSCYVAWYAPAVYGVVGQRFSFDVKPLDPQPLAIAPGRLVPIVPKPFFNPQVTSDGTNYLVSYQSVQAASAADVNASLISGADGALVGGTARFVSPLFEPGRWRWSFVPFDGAWVFVVSARGPGLSPALEASVHETIFRGETLLQNDPVSAATDGDTILAVFNSRPRTSSGLPSGLKTALVTRDHLASGMAYGGTAPENAPLTALDAVDPATPLAQTATVYEGQKYLVLWVYPGAQIFGALYPEAAEPLFDAAASEPAMATLGHGASLLVYASGGAVRARMILTDATAPAVTVPANISATADTKNGAIVDFSASALDDYSGALTPTCIPASGSRFAPGVTSVTCTAIDEAGNAGTASFNVTVTFAWSGAQTPAKKTAFKQVAPIKFRLVKKSAGIVDLTARLRVYRLVNGAVVVEPATSLPPFGDVFRYDPVEGQYVYNLAAAPGTFQAAIDMGDGVDRRFPLTAN